MIPAHAKRDVGGVAIGPVGAAARTSYVEVRGLDKIYHAKKGDILALKGIDFDLRQREFLSIVGPSGCGKSTLLNASPAFEPSGGAIEVDDADGCPAAR